MFKGRNGDFAVPGDSGAFIVNEHNQCVGMIALVDSVSHITYAISADQLAHSAGISFTQTKQDLV